MAHTTTPEAATDRTYSIIDGEGRTIVSGLTCRIEAQGFRLACERLAPENAPYYVGENIIP